MSASPKRVHSGVQVTAASDTFFDPGAYFDRWLADVNAALNQTPLKLPLPDPDWEEIFVESRIGSNCEVNFEGVMHFDGYSLGNVLSRNGTLVVSKRGRIEADIDVGTAIIDGVVTGNITASECVVLESDARVKGQIFTRALSMQLGAILDGDCLLVMPAPPAESREISPLNSVNFEQDSPVLQEDSVVLADEPAEELEEFLLSV
jgi:cytoskeletal protein CcmA (bactofilin family)